MRPLLTWVPESRARARPARRYAVLVAIASAVSVGATQATEPAVAGWIETVRIDPGRIPVRAKLDTGADFSSLDARELRWSQRDGSDWVSFEVTGTDGQATRIARPVVRVARVRSALGAGQQRPVVMLGICLGTLYRVVEVTLADRSRMNERMLIGRDFLRSDLVVDAGRKHLLEPACPKGPVP